MMTLRLFLGCGTRKITAVILETAYETFNGRKIQEILTNDE